MRHKQESEMNQKKILVVDDDWAVRELIKEFLALYGHIAITAENGSQAYEQIRFNQIDIVLLDLDMPKMDGIETVRAIRERHAEIPIIIISGRPDSKGVQEALDNGANDFLQKPFSPEALMEKCDRFK